MTMTHNDLTTLCAGALCFVLAAAAWGQDSSNGGSQTPLGDVVRHQQEQRQHSKTAKKVVSDDDIPANRSHVMGDWVAEFVIIPAVHISGLVPNDDSTTGTAMGKKQDKIYVGFGPHLLDTGTCSESLECAEGAFERNLQRGNWAGSKARILFTSDDDIQEYPARVAHFEVVHDVRGKVEGSAAFIQTPIAILTATCMYKAQDRPEAEPECDAFISSLQVSVPQRYIYVEHH
jgi:hypothetical protein